MTRQGWVPASSNIRGLGAGFDYRASKWPNQSAMLQVISNAARLRLRGQKEPFPVRVNH